MEATRFKENHARDVVKDGVACLQRACVIQWSLATSHPMDGFSRAVDTLVLEIKLQPKHLGSQHRWQCHSRLRCVSVKVLGTRLLGLYRFGRAPHLLLKPGVEHASRRFPRVL
jgi:hypothetical protein